MENQLFNKTEDALMNFLWSLGEPISLAKIMKQWEGMIYTERHMRFIISSLEEKGAIECCGIESKGRKYSRIYRCRITKEEYYTRVLDVNEVSLPKLLQAETVALANVNNGEDLDELICTLKEIIEKYENGKE